MHTSKRVPLSQKLEKEAIIQDMSTRVGRSNPFCESVDPPRLDASSKNISAARLTSLNSKRRGGMTVHDILPRGGQTARDPLLAAKNTPVVERRPSLMGASSTLSSTLNASRSTSRRPEDNRSSLQQRRRSGAKLPNAFSADSTSKQKENASAEDNDGDDIIVRVCECVCVCVLCAYACVYDGYVYHVHVCTCCTRILG